MKKIICIFIILFVISNLFFAENYSKNLKLLIGKKVIIQYSYYDKEIIGTVDYIDVYSGLISMTLIKDNGDVVICYQDDIASITILKENKK